MVTPLSLDDSSVTISVSRSRNTISRPRNISSVPRNTVIRARIAVSFARYRCQSLTKHRQSLTKHKQRATKHSDSLTNHCQFCLIRLTFAHETAEFRRGRLPGLADQIGRAQSELQSPCKLVCRLLLDKENHT